MIRAARQQNQPQPIQTHEPLDTGWGGQDEQPQDEAPPLRDYEEVVRPMPTESEYSPGYKPNGRRYITYMLEPQGAGRDARRMWTEKGSIADMRKSWDGDGTIYSIALDNGNIVLLELNRVFANDGKPKPRTIDQLNLLCIMKSIDEDNNRRKANSSKASQGYNQGGTSPRVQSEPIRPGDGGTADTFEVPEHSNVTFTTTEPHA